jgi:hypothetical protein
MDVKQRGLNAAMASEGGDFVYVPASTGKIG